MESISRQISDVVCFNTFFWIMHRNDSTGARKVLLKAAERQNKEHGLDLYLKEYSLMLFPVFVQVGP